MSSLIETNDIHKHFLMGTSVVEVLKGISLTVERGEFIAVMGASGSGKSTLLNILGCLDRPTSGSYRFDGMDVVTSSDRILSRMRAEHIGFVFQTFNLLHHLTVYENVELAFFYGRGGGDAAEEKILQAITKVGLIHRLYHRPAELSGGEMQRVAIARALCKEPEMILADEPTGNLDSRMGMEILDIFGELHDTGSTIIMITHDREVAARAQRIVIMKDGIFVA
jgi:putative ABC transport system ATP-binding protein